MTVPAEPANQIVIADGASLTAARGVRDRDLAVVRADRLKYHGLLPCALKYALWAVRPGGRIVIEDEAREDASGQPFDISSNLVRQWAFRFIGRDAALVEMTPGRLTLERTAPVLAPGWSAGVVFSGSDGEIPTLRACLEGLAAQPELAPEAGGEIVVCGPERDLSFLHGLPAVRYLAYEMPPGPRVMITQKKNFLMRAMKGPRLAVLHARIVLQPGALAAVPREFDVVSPNTAVMAGDRRVPYLSLLSLQTVWPGFAPTRINGTTRTLGEDPLAFHRRGDVVADGGCFFVSKPAFESCPLNDRIAWNEAEDVEWCGRAFLDGWLIDMAPDSRALSQTSKLRTPPDLGPLTRPALNGIAEVRALKAGLKYWMSRR